MLINSWQQGCFYSWTSPGPGHAACAGYSTADWADSPWLCHKYGKQITIIAEHAEYAIYFMTCECRTVWYLGRWEGRLRTLGLGVHGLPACLPTRPFNHGRVLVFRFCHTSCIFYYFRSGGHCSQYAFLIYVYLRLIGAGRGSRFSSSSGGGGGRGGRGGGSPGEPPRAADCWRG